MALSVGIARFKLSAGLKFGLGGVAISTAPAGFEFVTTTNGTELVTSGGEFVYARAA